MSGLNTETLKVVKTLLYIRYMPIDFQYEYLTPAEKQLKTFLWRERFQKKGSGLMRKLRQWIFE